MRRRLTITLQDSILDKLDRTIDGVKIRNRSHAIEYLLNKAIYSDQIQAIILAGGKGTRMRPLTYEIPKTMLPIKKKPILEYLIQLLRDANIKDIIVCTNKQGQVIQDTFHDGQRFNINLTYSFERTNLGTGGALLQVKKQLKSSPFLVIHGDIYCEIDLRELIAFHQQNSAVVTMALKPVKEAREFGQIVLKGSTVTEFFHKPTVGKSNLINSGVYVCNQEIFKYFPQSLEFDFEQVLVDLARRKQINGVNGYVYDSLWFDVGTPSEYEAAIKASRRV